MGTTKKQYDLVILGAGQTAGPLAQAAAKFGWSTAVVEELHPGGTCVNNGCAPTKTLIASAQAAHTARQAQNWGLSVPQVRVNWPQVRRRRDRLVEDFRGSSRRGLVDTPGIDLVEGRGRFTAPGEVEVRLSQGGTLLLQGKKTVINTGGTPRKPRLPGLDTIPWVDSRSIQEIPALPGRLIVAGGGYIGLEFGQMFRRFGVEVTIIHQGEHLLSREDEDLGREVEKIFQDEGITVFNRSRPAAAAPLTEGFSLEFQRPGGGETLKGDLFLAAVGREPATRDIGLEAAGVKTDSGGFIQVGDTLASTGENIWAVGDVKGGPAFTHTAYDDYRILRDQWFAPGGRRLGDRLVPYTVFIDPQLGRVGLSEKEARDKGLSYDLYKMPMNWVARALETGKTAGFMKVLASREDNRILGAAFLGMEGGEMATMLQLAMAGGLTTEDLGETLFPHPGLGESLNNLFRYGRVETP